MKKTVFYLAAFTAALNGTAIPAAHAEEETKTSPSVAETLESLEQRVRVLDRKLELEQEAAAERAKKTPVVSADSSGFSIKSPDGDFQLKLRGVAHFDNRWFFDSATPDTFLLRRVRPIIEGTLYKIYDFRFTPDFGGGKTVIQDAYGEARFQPWFKVRVGKFKVPFGLERLQSATDIKFIERALPTTIAPNRDIGIQLQGDVAEGTLNYAVSVTNGVLDGGSSENFSDTDNNSQKSYAARLFATPFKNGDNYALRDLGFGVAADKTDDTGSTSATDLPSYKTPGQQTFFSYFTSSTTPAINTYANGKRLRWSPQLYYYNGGFGLLSEYVVVNQDVKRINGAVSREGNLKNTAWQVALSYLLTGEDASYKSVKPKKTFGKDGWGAFELVARYSALKIDDDAFAAGASSFADPTKASREANAWAAGVNWYLNNNVKVALNYEQTRFSYGGGGTTSAPLDRNDEKVLFTRVQVAY